MSIHVRAAATNAEGMIIKTGIPAAVLMSGGVDSSVSALLLLNEGYDVIGVTMQITDNDIPVKKAKNVCDIIGIKHYTLDLRENFKKDILDYFKNSYENGLTPNPCVMCNEKIKFGEIYEFAKSLGMQFIATGHYGKTEVTDGFVYLKKSENLKKDQSYFLSRVDEEILKYTLFPLGDYDKEYVRQLADKYNLPPKDDKDSQDICFLEGIDYRSFLVQNYNFTARAGNFISEDGSVLGRHMGIHNYTIGQRKGLGAFGQPMIVKNIDAVTNDIILCTSGNEFFSSVFVKNLKFFKVFDKYKNQLITVKTRYSQNEAEVSDIIFSDDICEIKFKNPQRAVTPGQFVVGYYQKIVLFNGEIVKKV